MNGTSYHVFVSATSVIGTSNSAAVVGTPTSGKPKGPPGPVTALKAKAEVKKLSLSWKAPKDVGTGIASYSVCNVTAGTGCTSETATKIVLGSLKAGVHYKISVTAVAKDGEKSSATRVTATPKA